MEKTIKIGDQSVQVKVCASTAIRYQQVYGEHIDKTMFDMARKSTGEYGGGMYEGAAKLLYIMAWHCNPKLELNQEAAMKWLDSLDPLDANALTEILTLFFRK